MKKLIELDAALSAIGEVPTYNDGMVFEALSHAQRDVELLPTVDAVPVVHGEWIDKDGGIATCSVCGDRWGVWSVMKYCPNCGAKMNEEDNEQKKQF